MTSHCNARNLTVRAEHNAVLADRRASTTGGVGYHWPEFRYLSSGRRKCFQCETRRTDRQFKVRKMLRDELAGVYDVPRSERTIRLSAQRRGRKIFPRPRVFRDCKYHGLRVVASLGLDAAGRERPACLECKKQSQTGRAKKQVLVTDNNWHGLPAGARRMAFVTLPGPYFRRGVVVNGYGLARGMTGWELTRLDAKSDQYYAPAGVVVDYTSSLQDAIRLAQKS